jgi:Protein of unknown function (DUF2569)
MNPAPLDEQVRESISRLDDLEKRGGHALVAERVAGYLPPGPPTAKGTDLRLEQGSGIGGWLILPAIGLVFSVVTGTAQALSTAARFVGAPGIGTGLELVFVISWLLFAIVVAWFFMAKYRAAPYLYIAFMVANLALVSLYYRASAASEFPDATMKLMRALVSCAVWTPYFLTSKRVKLTFVK